MTNFRIATWNIERAVPARTEGLLARIGAANADIWIITETRDSFNLGGSYSPVSSDVQPGTLITGRWVTIWSRLPLIQRVPTRDPIRTAAALYETPLGKLLVFGTVLPWHSDRGPSGDAKNWAEHHRVIPEQADEWVALGEISRRGTLRGWRSEHEPWRRALLRHGAREGTAPGRVETRGTRLYDPHGASAHRETGRDPHIDHVCLPQGWAERAEMVDAWPGTIDRGATERPQRPRRGGSRLIGRRLFLNEEIGINPLQLVDGDRRYADSVRDHQPRQFGAVDQDDSRIDPLGILLRLGADLEDPIRRIQRLRDDAKEPNGSDRRHGRFGS